MMVIKCENNVEKKGVKRTCDRFLAKIMKEELMKTGFQIHLKCPSCGEYAIVANGENGVCKVHLKEGEGDICRKTQQI